MEESRKIWKFTGRIAQYYCAGLLAGFLLFCMILAAEAADAKPDPILAGPAPACGAKIPSADLLEDVDAAGRPVVPADADTGKPILADSRAVLPVRTPNPRAPRVEVGIDLGRVLAPAPSCLTPAQAQQNLPPKAAPQR